MFETLQHGKRRLSSEAKERIVCFIQSQLAENGAFMDKSKKADLYYTSFGLMLASVFDININVSQTEKWLCEQQNQLSDLVYYAAFIRSQQLCKLLQTGKLIFAFNQLFETKQRLPNFTNYPHEDIYSPYSQFMLLSLKEDVGIETESRQEILNALSAYSVETGGYSNIKENKHPATNATVAALAVKGQLCGYHADYEVEFLQTLQDKSGGFYASLSSPVPDLLSTATALFMLKCYGVTPIIDANDFIDAHWLPSGGFCATLLEESSDVEYTFYGLLALGASRK